MFPLCCLLLLSCDFPYVGSSSSLQDGTSLLIPLGLKTQEPPFLVMWKKEGALLGRIHRGQCTYGCSEMFSVLSNGSLFLSQVQREAEGTYMAVVYNESGVLVHQAEILLHIVDHMIDLNLESGSPDYPKQVVWSKGAEEVGNASMEVCIQGCIGHSHVFSNGSLFLRRVQKADEGMYSARTLNSSLSPLLQIFLYINVSDVEATNEGSNNGSTSVPLVFFICMIIISCLGVLTFIALGRFLWKKRKMEKSDDGKSCVSYTEIRRKSHRSGAERSSPRNDTGPWAELGGNKEEIGEVETLSTFR
ncbi:immunoglobulin superfamily member 10-like isoform X2 [Phyllobates terribilis]|uniref:immunoglobulin superfamily member 10-like isoform X2 n=1 Tax=Phyllobates terribilis TaxID=111132 RepID=UPI003CCAE390